MTKHSFVDGPGESADAHTQRVTLGKDREGILALGQMALYLHVYLSIHPSIHPPFELSPPTLLSI